MADAKETKNNPLVQIPLCDEEKGSIKISSSVVATIVRKYALAVEGVMRPAPQGIVEGLASLLSRRPSEGSIALDMTDEGVNVTLSLILKFGCNVPEVAAEIQAVLFDKIPSMTGYQVLKVNVNVVDLEEDEQPEEEKTEEIAE